MPKEMEIEGNFEETWEKILKWMRLLPIWFKLTHIPVIGKKLFHDSYVGDPTARMWTIPVSEDINPDLTNVHLPIDIISQMIDKAALKGKIKECVCRAAFDCHEYAHDLACLALGTAFEGAEEVGLAEGIELMTKEEAHAFIQKAISFGLVPTIAWDNDIEMFGAERNKGIVVCLCCNCCCDIRLGLRLGNDEFKKKVIRPEGVSVVVSDACELYGDCAEPEVCCVSAIHLGPKKSVIDLDLCVGCGACVQICPEGAISFVLDPGVDFVNSLLAEVETYTDIT
jgi:NAD-dependent dihydropyrimidine dehydrogenase PreA subunit